MTPATAAIVGYTGFVGSNLLARPSRTLKYDYLFNSKNVATLGQRSYEAVVCSAVPAIKWLANKNPSEDWAQISALLAQLRNLRTERFILISTVDVYPDPAGGNDEGYDFEAYADHAYGRHRRMVEEWVIENYPLAHTIIRLPALFGEGLKKNALFDLMTKNMLEKVSSGSAYQWYSLARLAGDVDTTLESGLTQINLVTPPIQMRTIQERFFPAERIGGMGSAPATYDVRTAHADVFGHPGRGYIADEEATLREMEGFLAAKCGTAG
ncbi:NAD-dependent epimerase/dehydratase family protein [Methylobacterium haplocladii]|uniref:NAD-dependent epimerase/dehydratase domain-containing protein n=1 Tax=Methylobacterium haplocladii TaxID=1176176 RepID=A0A512IW07_9HYPH|nr:NAD-dependent epimerase/dehydratase family protein [Methylobacterium haplocladii]GEP01914.1 hypothetical protein MHA02_43010 [Methylobacterium haplocladii]GJD86190.1 hypothetical protein HPGCJGGD_4087 [Methylobacterium haplocladii]GLS61241.1 hypothetical protein GCM10007887_39390 [Methylobacterium haplocladii]